MKANLRTLLQVCREDLAWVLSLFLVAMGARLYLILNSHGSLPFWDQWNGEAADIFIPYFENQLSLADFFKAHNEHRVLFTRLFALGMVLVNGQWDAQLQMVLNACLHCGTVTGFGWVMARRMGARYWPFIWLPLSLVMILPFGWENALWAFQSLFYFQILFSLLTIWLLGTSKPLSPRWRLGILTGVASIFTTGGGFLVAPAVGGMALFEIARNRQSWRQHWPTLAASAAIAMTGILLNHQVPEHQVDRAHSVGEYLTALGNYLSWPTGLYPWLAILNMLPVLALGWVYFRSKSEINPASQMILGVALWVVFQGLAAAFARGVGGRPPVWRYMDTACFMMIANCLGIAMLLGHYRTDLRLKPIWYAAFAIWAVPCVLSLCFLTERARTVAIPIWNERQAIRLETARAFMATDDDKILSRQDPVNILHPYVPFVAFLMRTPHIRNILPACVREPLKVVPASTTNAVFITNGWHLTKPDPPTEQSWGSYTAAGAAAQGIFESGPIKPGRFAFLEIPVAGNAGNPGLSLELVELETGRVRKINVPQGTDGQWQNAYVRSLDREFKIVARDESSTGWIAFKAPREIACLSYFAESLVSAWKYVSAIGCVCLLSALVCLLRRRRESL